ncbi:MAG: SufS family cysteine desulfurase [Flavobacteriales bacterium]|nr:SufS family cysteine desulfurase [Flavobacteriales bacterium]
MSETLVDIESIRAQFPILQREVNGKPLIYFDNGATSQKPQSVIDAITHYYEHENSNIHRGVHTLSQEATSAYEDVRKKVQKFINAEHDHEIIFTSGTTGGINLVASSFGENLVRKGDEILITAMEHHSNIVPWQMLCERKGAHLKVVPISKEGELDLEEYERLIGPKTELISLVHVSNSLGTINPIKKMIDIAHAQNIPVLIDGAQAIHHTPVDVRELDCDFYVFSSHKMYGPTGVGILYGKEELLNDMAPYQGGGDMIKNVTFEKTIYNDLPHKFEAGTPNIAGGIGLGAAIDFINSIGYDFIMQHEAELSRFATSQLRDIKGLRFIGTAKERAGLVSFVLDGIHPYDTGVILDKLGLALRTGHHCTQPVMTFFEVPGTVRASFAVYNTKQEVIRLVEGIERVKRMF